MSYDYFLEIISQVSITDFEDEDALEELQETLESLERTEYREFFHKLGKYAKEDFYVRDGYQFLAWLLHNTPDIFAAQEGDRNHSSSRSPVHTAINIENSFFLDTFLTVAKDFELGIESILNTPDGLSRSNCLQAAISRQLPCAFDMISKCSESTILAKDSEFNTPLHIAMREGQLLSGPRIRFQHHLDNSSLPSAANTKAKLKKPGASRFEDSGGGDSLDSFKGNLASVFDPGEIYRQIKVHMLHPEMSWEKKSEFMVKLLSGVNNDRKSPYQILTERVQHKAETVEIVKSQAVGKSASNSKQRDIGATRKKAEDAVKAAEAKLLEEMKDDIFLYITDIETARKALYGIDGPDKELFLDLSDFSNPSHDFGGFIGDLTSDLPKPKPPAATGKEPEQQKADDGEPSKLKNETKGESTAQKKSVLAVQTKPRRQIEFESTLFYVCLPNFNNFKEPPHAEVRRLFNWLAYRGVKVIRNLAIPDSSLCPMADVLVQGAIISKFRIEKIDWRKLDINLEMLTKSIHASEIKYLTLYSSGNWSVLHHWISDEGIKSLSGLQELTIRIVQLDPRNDSEAHSLFNKNITQYKSRIDPKLEEIKTSRENEKKPKFKGDVVPGERWNYPVTQYEPNLRPFVPSLKLIEQLENCHSFLKRLVYDSKGVSIPEELAGQFSDRSLLKRVVDGPSLNQDDVRIKVAVIDNGVDRIRESVSDMIAKGVSYVTAGAENGNQILPWWMAADPHGTQMASLIKNANPFCRLYIARVGKGRRDVLPQNAAEAVRWAIEQKVDIISISWVTKRDHPALECAIKHAVDATKASRPILVFCSTADEGIYSGKVYPAAYPDTVRVAATDQYGHLQPESDGGVNILVPGQDVAVDGPSYMKMHAASKISGSSVATASAAGIASLALLLLKVVNNAAEGDERLRKFYTKDGIMKVFERMHDKRHGRAEVTGVELSGLFPDSKPDSDFPNDASRRRHEELQLKALFKEWKFSEFERR